MHTKKLLKLKSFGFFSPLFWFAAALLVWNCNVSDSPKIRTYIDLTIPDSLSTANGYESILVSITDLSGNVIYPKLFEGPYNKTPEEKSKLSKIELPGPVPQNFVIKITGFKKGLAPKNFEITVAGTVSVVPKSDTSKVVVIPPVTPVTPANPTTAPTIQFLMSVPLNLSLQDTTKLISAKVLPDTIHSDIIWSSSDTSLLQIKSNLKLIPIKVGNVTVTGKLAIDNKIQSQFAVKIVQPVKTDTITVSPKTLSLFAGGPSAQLKATNSSGDTLLSYNFVSANILLASVDGSSGLVKGLASGKTTITASVVGYPLIASVCSVTVQTMPAPVVKIIDPAAAITINSTTYKIKYTVKDSVLGINQNLDSTVNLVDGVNTIIIAKSNVGGTGSDQVKITLNRSAPGIPIFVSQPLFTKNKTITWTWGAVTGSSKYQVRLGDGDFTKTTGTTETTTLTYSATETQDAEYILFIRSVDAIDNFSSTASQSVTLDTKAPDAVTFKDQNNAFKDVQNPTWSWQPSTTNSGINFYEVTLDSAKTPIVVTTTSFTPTSLLSDNASHTVTVRQRDRVDEQLGAPATLTFQIITTPPSAPTVVNQGTTNNGARTNNPNFTWTDGVRGNSIYRVKINDVIRETNNTTKIFKLGDAELDGAYNISVEEQDALGRWGVAGMFKIVLDRTGPVITFPYTTFVTSVSPAKFRYKVDGVDFVSSTCVLSNDNGAATNCKIEALDDLQNKTTAVLQVYWKSNTIFITQNGNGKGTSWEDSRSDLALVAKDTNNIGKEFWVTSGSFGEIRLINHSKLYGGFDSSSSPVSISDRKGSRPIFSNIGAVELHSERDTMFVDGFSWTGTLTSGFQSWKINNCNFIPTLGKSANYIINLYYEGSLFANNIEIIGGEFTGEIINSGNTTITNGTIKNNNANTNNNSSNPTIGTIGTWNLNGNTIIEGNKNNSIQSYQFNLGTGQKIITNSPNIPCTNNLWFRDPTSTGTWECH